MLGSRIKWGRGNQQSSVCVGFSEINKYAIRIYKTHFPNHKEYGDVSKITWADVEDFDFLVGGFPCQSFSIAGKRKGFNDTRGIMFFEIERCLREKQPRLLLLENVKGLLSHDKGRTFGVILNTLDELGYDLQWQVLNSKNFGVPQNRERVFIIGHFRGTRRPEVFPIGQADQLHNKLHNKNDKQKLAKCLDSNYHKGWLDHGQRTMISYGTSQDQKLSQNISQSLNAGHYNQPKIEVKVANTVTPDAYLATGKRKRVNGKAVLTSMHERRIRRLTPIECERLQGFPDGWTEGISDTQRYKCLGNAVTTYVIEAIISKLI